MAEEEIVRGAAGAVCEGSDSDPTRGDFGRAAPLLLAPGLRNGDAVRLTTGGVWVLEGGLLGRFIDGLSQDEKKSSLGSPEGVAVPSPDGAATMSVMTTSPGYLHKGKLSWASDACLLTRGHLRWLASLTPLCILLQRLRCI